MAQVPEFKRLMREDFAEIEEEWVDRLIYPINTFNEQVYAALNQALTVGDNVVGVYRDLTFTTLSTYSTGGWTNQTINWPYRTAPKSVTIGAIHPTDSDTVIKTAVSLDWKLTSPNVITIRYVAGLANSTKYTATLLCM